jgi:hypothetical protein
VRIWSRSGKEGIRDSLVPIPNFSCWKILLFRVFRLFLSSFQKKKNIPLEQIAEPALHFKNKTRGVLRVASTFVDSQLGPANKTQHKGQLGTRIFSFWRAAQYFQLSTVVKIKELVKITLFEKKSGTYLSSCLFCTLPVPEIWAMTFLVPRQMSNRAHLRLHFYKF